MLCNAAEETEIGMGTVVSWAGAPWRESGLDWQVVDRALRTIRQRRATLDAEEARWLREAEALQIWRPLGMVSALDYMERVLGYAPRTAQDRLRVARVLEGATNSETSGRAKFQIAVTVCERCRQGWQEGAGARVAIEAAAVERAMCDAQHIGSIDGAGPERAHQDIPPSTARFVWRRDGGRCRVPGCRSARGLEIHHLVHRADGGSHDAFNLALLCSSCHLAHHRGALTISGTADQLEVRRPGRVLRSPDIGEPIGASSPSAAACASGRVQAHGALVLSVQRNAGEPAEASDADIGAHVGAPGRSSMRAESDQREPVSKLDMAILRTQARVALTGLGWKPAIAHAAVDAAAATQGPELTLERLIFESLRRCPAPRA